MDFIHVLGRPNDKVKEKDYELATLNVTNRALISLIHGLSQKNFGFDTVKDIALQIQDYKKSKAVNFDLYIDSGGYSIIQGDVPFDKTHMFIESYHQYLEYHHQDFNYIFSLDIPIWGKKGEEEKNTIENLYEFNKISLSYSCDLLQKHKQALIDKFLFVWHFKILDQFETWNKIYDELEINSWIKNRAIGGLVGLRGDLKYIDFSVFIPMAFRCFYDHLDSPYADDIFKLHFLGINRPQDRFVITLLEKLFQHYLKNPSGTDFTYDSINYTKNALFQSRAPAVFNFTNNELTLYKNVHKLPNDIIDHVYFTPDLKEGFLAERKLLANFEKLKDSPVFVPLNVYSNMMLDKYCAHLIDEYQFIDILTSTDFKTKAMKQAYNALHELEQNETSVFSVNFFKELKNDFDMIFDLHQLYVQGRDRRELNNFIRKVVTERIRYPFKFK